MKKSLGQSVFLVFAFSAILLALTCGTTRADVLTINFDEVTFGTRGVFFWSDFFDPDLGPSPIAKYPPVKEQLIANWAVDYTKVSFTLPQTFVFTKSDGTTVADFLTITKNDDDTLHFFFQSEGAPNFPAAGLSNPTQLFTEPLSAPEVLWFTLTVDNNPSGPDDPGFCDGLDTCQVQWVVRMFLDADTDPIIPGASVPEPATTLLLGLGLIGALGMSRKSHEEA